MRRPIFVFLCVIGLNCGATAFGDEVADAIESIRREHGIAATAYFIVSPNSVDALETFGTTRADNNAPFELDHLVRIGSITKTFTALAAVILHERRQLSLDNAVTDILPDPPLQNPWAKQRPVRIAHLIEHTAGLPDLSKREFDFNRPVSLSEAFQLDPNSRLLAWVPGLHSSYSNSGAGILSSVIEKASGRTYEAFITDEIFSALGMASARFTVAATESHRLIAGYDSDGHTPIKYWHTLYRAFGAISVTPRDMIPFVQLFLNRGKHADRRIISAAAISRMEIPQTTLAAHAGLTYGYGLGIYQYQRRGVSFFGHGGDADGYLAFFAYSPTRGRGYFVVINAFNNDALRQMRRIIEDKIIGSANPTPPVPDDLSSAQLRRLSGTYRQVTQRFGRQQRSDTIDVVVDDGGIYTTADGSRRRAMLPVTPWHFRRRDQTAATIAFIPCGNQLYLQGDFGNYAKQIEGERLAPCSADIVETQAATTQRTPVPPIPQ